MALNPCRWLAEQLFPDNHAGTPLSSSALHPIAFPLCISVASLRLVTSPFCHTLPTLISSVLLSIQKPCLILLYAPRRCFRVWVLSISLFSPILSHFFSSLCLIIRSLVLGLAPQLRVSTGICSLPSRPVAVCHSPFPIPPPPCVFSQPSRDSRSRWLAIYIYMCFSGSHVGCCIFDCQSCNRRPRGAR